MLTVDATNRTRPAQSSEGGFEPLFLHGKRQKIAADFAEKVDTLVQRIRGFKDVKGDSGVIKVDYAFAAFTNGNT